MRILFFILLLSPSFAFAASPRETFANIKTHCVTSLDAQCREYFTASSYSLYDRFNSYGLARCIPKDMQYVSEKSQPPYVIIRAGTSDNGRDRVMRLAFKNETGDWRLDVPASLKIGMGENWQKQIDTIEQVYLILRQQFGGELNCDSVRKLIK